MLKVSLKQATVNPSGPVWQAGGATRTDKARGIYSDVKVMALTLEVNQERMILTTMDTVAIEQEDVSWARSSIAKATGIKAKYVFVIATHTHSAPALKNSSKTDDVVDKEYKEFIFKELVDTAVLSANSTEEVTAYAKCGEIWGYYGNRDRKDKDGDQSAYLLTFKNMQEETIAALIDIHCHPTFLDQSWLLISADMAGALREHLAPKLGVEPMFVCGTTGDMSSRYYRTSQDYFTLENSAEAMAEIICKFENEVELDINELNIEEVQYRIQRSINLNDYATKLDLYLEQEKTETDPIEKRLLATKIRGARTIIESKEDTIDITLKTSIINLGDLQIVTFNNDPVVLFGKQIKQASPRKLCITMNHVNGEVGYLVERQDFNTGYIGNVTKALPGQAEEYIEKIIKEL